MTDLIRQACDRARHFEGYEPAAYQCPAGKWTIGFGTNLQRREMPAGVMAILAPILIACINTGCAVGRNWTGLVMTPEVAKALMVADMTACNWRLLELFEDRPTPAQLALLDMAYNMGVSRLLTFKRMFAALDAGDWETAADELLDSRYAKQVSERAASNADLLQGLGVEDMTTAQRLARLERRFPQLPRRS